MKILKKINEQIQKTKLDKIKMMELSKLKLDPTYKDVFNQEAKKVGIEKFISKLPFVYVYERIDMSTTLYGINIYPQLIRDSLLHEDLQKHVTGKFTLSTNFDDQQNQFLDLHIELKKGAIIQDDLKNMICNSVVDFLYKYSSEYKELKDHIGEKAYPRITLWNNGESDYFKPGIKQKWIKK